MDNLVKLSEPDNLVKFSEMDNLVKYTFKIIKMASPTFEEILEIPEEPNYPSATKLRAALIKRGYKARLKDVEEIVESQTPTQLFAKAPTYRGKLIASRPNERWVIDFIVFTAEPSGQFKYIFLTQGIFSRKLWSKALGDNDMISAIQQLRT